jgi:RNA dependent RNA polymerase
LKLRAVNHPKLSHLVDCLVFATVARPGHKAAPSMSSGGDLDGNIQFNIPENMVLVKGLSKAMNFL